MGFYQKLRRFCKRNGLTDKQQLYLESLVALRIEELRCPACGETGGCGCASPGWPYYSKPKFNKKKLMNFDNDGLIS